MTTKRKTIKPSRMAKGKAVRTKAKPSKEKQSYAGLRYTPDRQWIYPVARSNEFDLRGHRRALSWATAIDLDQNLTLIGWAVRKILDFTSAWEFQPRTGDPQYDLYLKRWYRDRTSKNTLDVTRRQSLASMFRSFCASKILFGDGLIAKTTGGRLQIFEGSSITQGGLDAKLTGDARARAQAEIESLSPQGLVVDDFGAVAAYGIATGTAEGSYVHRMLLPWQAAVYDGWFVRPSVLRPPSPLLPAMNFARDFLDNTQYRLLQAKIQSMFGIVILRDHQMVGNHDFQYSEGTPTDASLGTSPQSGPKEMLDFALEPGLKLELEREDDAKFLESHAPSAEWLEFSKELARLILAALNIPYSVYDSKGASYSAQRGDVNLFRISLHEEREKCRASYRECVAHVIDGGVADGSLELPVGMQDAADLEWHLYPRGTFVTDMQRETPPIQQQVAAGHRTNEDACHELGLGDFYEITERLAAEQAFQKALGVQVVLGIPGELVSTDMQGEDEETGGGTEPTDEKDSSGKTTKEGKQ